MVDNAQTEYNIPPQRRPQIPRAWNERQRPQTPPQTISWIKKKYQKHSRKDVEINLPRSASANDITLEDLDDDYPCVSNSCKRSASVSKVNINLAIRSSSTSVDTHSISLSRWERWEKVKRLFIKSAQDEEKLVDVEHINEPKRKTFKIIVKRLLSKGKRSNKRIDTKSLIGSLSDDEVSYDEVEPFNREASYISMTSEVSMESQSNHVTGSVNTYQTKRQDSIEISPMYNTSRLYHGKSTKPFTSIQKFDSLSYSIPPAKLVLMSPFEAMVTTNEHNASRKYIPKCRHPYRYSTHFPNENCSENSTVSEKQYHIDTL